MNDQQQETLKIYLLLKKNKQDEAGIAPLYARITPPGQKLFEVYTKINVPVKYWEPENQQLINRSKNPQLAKEIKQMVDKIEEAHEELTNSGGFYSPEEFRSLLFGERKKLNPYTYQFIYKKHLEIENEDLAEGSWKNYRSTHRFFQEYLKSLRLKDVAVSRINRQLIIEFMAWLRRRTPDKGQRPCSRTTAQKHAERLVRLLNFAVEMEYIPFNPIKKLDKKTIKKDRTYLEQEELELLETAGLSSPSLAEIRDCFLFSCYTGLSFSDIKSFCRKDLVRDLTSNLGISKIRKKTERCREIKFFVPLLQPAVALLDKYKDHPVCLHNDVLFPVRSNQVYNRRLKQLATMLKIDKVLTTHVARHTFATTITQDNGISLESISQMLAHTQIKTTQIYSKTTVRKVAGEMDLLRKKLASLSDTCREIETG